MLLERVSLARESLFCLKLMLERLTPHEFITKIADLLPDTDTSSKIRKSLSVPYSYRIDTVKTILGNGSKIMTQDTVPFSIWCAS